MKILVTGGCGYIGSHTCVQLLEAGHDPVIIDNYCNSKETVLSRIADITGSKIRFYKGDVRDSYFLDMVFAQEEIDTVIHFAGLKAVGESIEQPLRYYDNNLNGTLRLVEAMGKAGVRRLVFSSSATVYGTPKLVPIREDFATSSLNPYGETKLFAEHMLTALQKTDSSWSIMLLRYFNPVGAHPTGLMGEDPLGVPNNLVPYIAQVAAGRLPFLKVYGNDYPTPDGTGIRDYIHVLDLADGHIAALNYAKVHPGCHVFNLGTGRGISVLQMITAFSEACGCKIPYQIVPRRPGDAAEVWSDPAKAKSELGWVVRYDLSDMVSDVWRWQSKNPQGYTG